MSNLSGISEHTASMLEAVNGSAKKGIEITAFRLVTREDELFEDLRKMARPAFLEDDQNTVNNLFDRATDPNAEKWKEAQLTFRKNNAGDSPITEFGVIGFYGPNAKATAQMIKNAGGHVAIIPKCNKTLANDSNLAEELEREYAAKVARADELRKQMNRKHKQAYDEAFNALRDELRKEHPKIKNNEIEKRMQSRHADLINQQKQIRHRFNKRMIEPLNEENTSAYAAKHSKRISALDDQDVYLMEAPFAQILQEVASRQDEVFSQNRGIENHDKRKLFAMTIKHRLNGVEQGGVSRS